ncbi:hypothetical protein C6Y13_15005 [Lactiplantibacillus pentosus]|nr:hypothetical protein C6Y13_15005 [Lactiplantibacillus pentosus]
MLVLFIINFVSQHQSHDDILSQQSAVSSQQSAVSSQQSVLSDDGEHGGGCDAADDDVERGV